MSLLCIIYNAIVKIPLESVRMLFNFSIRFETVEYNVFALIPF